jgi:O-antigen ligase
VTQKTAKNKMAFGGIRTAATLMLLAPLLSLHRALVMAPLLSLLAACLLFGLIWRPSRWTLLRAALKEQRPLPGLFALFLTWVLAACFWSFDPLFSLRSVAMLVGTVTGGWVMVVLVERLSIDQQERLINALAVGLGVAGLAMVAVGIVERSGLIDVGRLLWAMDADTTIVATLIWPTLAWQFRFGRRRSVFGLLLVSFAGVFLAHDLAAKVALLGGGLAWLVGRWRPLPTLRCIAVLAVAGCLLAPLAARLVPPSQESAEWSWLPWSAHHRLTIWSFTTRHIAEKPFFGWGFDGARAIPGGKTQIPVVRLKGCAQNGVPIPLPGFETPVASDCIMWEESLPLHPHDGWLQIWLELGGVGACIAALLLWKTIGRIVHMPAVPTAQAAASATLVAGLIICSVSFGIWQSWWLSTLWIAAALLSPLFGGAKQDI